MEKLLWVLLALCSRPIVTKTVVTSSYQVREPRQESCWELVSRGRRLQQDYITRTVPVNSLAQCQKECQDVLFNCETISFGYDRFRNGTCDLSDWDAASLSTRQTLANDDSVETSSFVIYSRFGSGANRRCSVSVDAVNTQSIDTAAPAKLYPTSRPYETDTEKYNSGFSEGDRVALDALSVAHVPVPKPAGLYTAVQSALVPVVLTRELLELLLFAQIQQADG